MPQLILMWVSVNMPLLAERILASARTHYTAASPAQAHGSARGRRGGACRPARGGEQVQSVAAQEREIALSGHRIPQLLELCRGLGLPALAEDVDHLSDRTCPGAGEPLREVVEQRPDDLLESLRRGTAADRELLERQRGIDAPCRRSGDSAAADAAAHVHAGDALGRTEPVTQQQADQSAQPPHAPSVGRRAGFTQSPIVG